MNVQVHELLADRHINAPLTVAGKSSVYQGNNERFGANLALVSTTGYWHSASSDLKPWIGFKMSSTFEVAVVEVDDRKDCDNCRGRWKNVEVLVGPSSDINDSGVQSCGATSYNEGDTKLHYM